MEEELRSDSKSVQIVFFHRTTEGGIRVPIKQHWGT
jgi:hypothetical protein